MSSAGALQPTVAWRTILVSPSMPRPFTHACLADTADAFPVWEKERLALRLFGKIGMTPSYSSLQCLQGTAKCQRSDSTRHSRPLTIAPQSLAPSVRFIRRRGQPDHSAFCVTFHFSPSVMIEAKWAIIRSAVGPMGPFLPLNFGACGACVRPDSSSLQYTFTT